MVIFPAFTESNIPVFMSCNNAYSPYMYAAIKSVAEHATDSYNYDFIVLNTGLDEECYHKICCLCRDKHNISIRFFNVNENIEGYDFFTESESGAPYLSPETYFKILIPYIVSDTMEKAVYLDCDVLVRTDIAELFCYDFHGNYIAAVRDVCDNCTCTVNAQLRKYREDTFPGEDFQDYINAGVIFMNLPLIRQFYSEEEMMKLAVSREWRKHDQDVLNYVCMGKIEYLPLEWNCIECQGDRIQLMGAEVLEEYQNAMRSPKIFHFATRKPWKETGIPFEREFWIQIQGTPVFCTILRNFRSEMVYHILIQEIKERKIGVCSVFRILYGYLRSRLL